MFSCPVGLILDILLPATDTGVALQLVVVLVVVGLLVWRFRANLDVRLLIIGTAIVTLGLMGIRALH